MKQAWRWPRMGTDPNDPAPLGAGIDGMTAGELRAHRDRLRRQAVEHRQEAARWDAIADVVCAELARRS